MGVPNLLPLIINDLYNFIFIKMCDIEQAVCVFETIGHYEFWEIIIRLVIL